MIKSDLLFFFFRLAFLKVYFMYYFENGLGKGDSRQSKNVVSWVALAVVLGKYDGGF